MFYFCLLHFGGFLTFAQVQRIGHNGLARHIWYISLILYYCLKEYFFCFLFSKFFFYWNPFWFIINLITLWLQVREYILVVIVFSFISPCLFFHCCPIIFRQAYFVCSQIKLSILLFGLAAGVRHRPRSTWSPRHCRRRRRRLCSALLKGLFGVDGQAWTWTCGWECTSVAQSSHSPYIYNIRIVICVYARMIFFIRSFFSVFYYFCTRCFEKLYYFNLSMCFTYSCTAATTNYDNGFILIYTYIYVLLYYVFWLYYLVSHT